MISFLILLWAQLPVSWASPLEARALGCLVTQDEEEESAPEVSVRALPDTTRFVPGKVFHLAVLFDIPSHWHIYWENSGDTGFPTEVRARVPEGVETLPVRYPGPQRFHSDGGLVSFGYEGQAALFLPIRVPKDSDLEKLEVELEVSWLVCKEACFLGDTTLTVNLERALAPSAAEPANGGLLDPHWKRLPQPASTLEGLEVEFMGELPVRDARLRIPGTRTIEFFPSADAPLVFNGQRASRTETHSELLIDLSAPYGVEDPDRELRGVLRVESKDGPRFYQLQFKDSAER